MRELFLRSLNTRYHLLFHKQEEFLQRIPPCITAMSLRKRHGRSDRFCRKAAGSQRFDDRLRFLSDFIHQLTAGDALRFHHVSRMLLDII